MQVYSECRHNECKCTVSVGTMSASACTVSASLLWVQAQVQVYSVCGYNECKCTVIVGTTNASVQ